METENMTLVMVRKEDIEEIKNQLKEIKQLILNKAVEEANDMWIESEQARKILGVSQRHWQTMRDRREIPFSQYGRKIYFYRPDIEAFLRSHKVASNAQYEQRK